MDLFNLEFGPTQNKLEEEEERDDETAILFYSMATHLHTLIFHETSTVFNHGAKK